MTVYNFPQDKPIPKLIDVLSGTSSSGSSSSGTSQTAVTVGTGSGLVLAAGGAVSFIKLAVPQTASNGIWVRWDGGVATQATPSEYLAPGQSATWIRSGGYMPSEQINAIASASVSVTLIHD